MPFDRYVSLVRHDVSISHDESIPDDKASACALTLGVILPGEEVVGPEARQDRQTDTLQELSIQFALKASADALVCVDQQCSSCQVPAS